MPWQDRIVSAPDTLHGATRFRGTRISVSIVLENLATGATTEALHAQHPICLAKRSRDSGLRGRSRSRPRRAGASLIVARVKLDEASTASRIRRVCRPTAASVRWTGFRITLSLSPATRLGPDEISSRATSY